MNQKVKSKEEVEYFINLNGISIQQVRFNNDLGGGVGI